jgi:hypothetical protein
MYTTFLKSSHIFSPSWGGVDITCNDAGIAGELLFHFHTPFNLYQGNFETIATLKQAAVRFRLPTAQEHSGRGCVRFMEPTSWPYVVPCTSQRLSKVQVVAARIMRRANI